MPVRFLQLFRWGTLNGLKSVEIIFPLSCSYFKFLRQTAVKESFELLRCFTFGGNYTSKWLFGSSVSHVFGQKGFWIVWLILAAEINDKRDLGSTADFFSDFAVFL